MCGSGRGPSENDFFFSGATPPLCLPAKMSCSFCQEARGSNSLRLLFVFPPKCLGPLPLSAALVVGVPELDGFQQLRPINRRFLRFEQADDLPQMFAQVFAVCVEQRNKTPFRPVASHLFLQAPE